MALLEGARQVCSTWNKTVRPLDRRSRVVHNGYPRTLNARCSLSPFPPKDGSPRSAQNQEISRPGLISRRSLNLSIAYGGAATWWSTIGLPSSQVAHAAEVSLEKTRNLPIEDLKGIIAGDIGERQYFITGNLSRSIYREDCRFKDPTNVTVGVDRYLAALTILFDPEYSKQELVDISLTPTDGDMPAVIATWRLGGYLKFPWRPRVVPFTGTTKYEFDEDGLVALHEERWSISPFTALLETVTPTFGPKQML